MIGRQLADPVHDFERSSRGVLEYPQHKFGEPGRALFLFRHGEGGIILLPPPQDFPAGVQHRQGQIPLLAKKQDIQNAPRAPVPVVERVDALELHVGQGNFDERVGWIHLVIVHIFQHVQQQPLQERLAVRRGINHFAFTALHPGHPRQAAFKLGQICAQTRRIRGELCMDGLDIPHGQHAARLQDVHAGKQGGLVANDLLGGFRVFAKRQTFVQLVIGGDDVFDLAAAARLLIGQQVEQQIRRRHLPHLVIQQRNRHPGLFRQPTQSRRFPHRPRRQQGQPVVGHHRIHLFSLQNL